MDRGLAAAAGSAPTGWRRRSADRGGVDQHASRAAGRLGNAPQHPARTRGRCRLNRRGADRGRAGADVPGCAVRESGVGDAISEGADAVVARLQDNNAWIREHEEGIRNFLARILPAAKDAAGGSGTGVLGGRRLTARTCQRRRCSDVRLPRRRRRDLALDPGPLQPRQSRPGGRRGRRRLERSEQQGPRHRARGVDRQFGARSKAEQEHSGAAPIAQRRPGPAAGGPAMTLRLTSSGTALRCFPSARRVPESAGIVGDPRTSRVAAMGAHEAADPRAHRTIRHLSLRDAALFASRRSPVRSRLAPWARSPSPSRIRPVGRVRGPTVCSTFVFPTRLGLRQLLDVPSPIPLPASSTARAGPHDCPLAHGLS